MLIDSHRIPLTPQEHSLFMALWNARGAYRTRYDLLECFESNGEHCYVLIRHAILRLREKLAPTKFVICNTYGRGYCLKRWAGPPRLAA